MKRAKELIKIINTDKEQCMGQVWALEELKILKNTPDPKNKIDEKITNYFFLQHAQSNKPDDYISPRWIKKYLKKLNPLLSSKSEKTRIKREIAIIDEYFRYDWNLTFAYLENDDLADELIKISEQLKGSKRIRKG